MDNDLKILKRGQSGKGILIEHDAGFISPNEPRNLPFINEIKKLDSGKVIIEEPLVVYVILQKYGVLNRNGRVYPEAVLKKQNDLYQKMIKERAAVGECVPAGTEIFTTSGWKNIEDVNVNDEIFTMNVNTNKLEKQFVLNTIKKPYNDDMIHIYNNSTLDMMITKKHKVVLWDRNNKPYILTGEELYQKIQDNDEIISMSHIKNAIVWDNDSFELIHNTLDNTENVFTYPNIDSLSGISLDLRFIKSELVPFNDDVYCVTVPNNTWLMRYNGKISWTHNCDHPDTSIIAADRISHNILETWWEGKTLMGKMEILMSPGFINYGIVSTKGDEVANLLRNRIKIGVSSRGVGSLKEGKNNEQIVQDDFEIICWDVVTAPSTPDAWMFKNIEEAQPYVESYQAKNEIIKEDIKNSLDNFLLS